MDILQDLPTADLPTELRSFEDSLASVSDHQSDNLTESDVESINLVKVIDSKQRHIPKIHNREEHIEQSYLITENSLSEAPTRYREAHLSAEGPEWTIAEQIEFENMEQFDVWDVVTLPSDANIIKSRWVYVNKFDAVANKWIKIARMCALGYMQIKGIDYDATFAQVVRYSSLRLILSLINQYDCELEMMDAVAAFLNGDLDYDIYMKLPEGYRLKKKDENVANVGLKLKKALYGLKQAPRQWMLKIAKFLRQIGLTPLVTDPCIWTRGSFQDGTMVGIVLFVDDFLVFGASTIAVRMVQDALSNEYRMKNLGPVGISDVPTKFIGFEITRDRVNRKLHLSQFSYTKKILEKLDLFHTTTPIDPKIDYLANAGTCSGSELEDYQSKVGSLQHLVQGTRPDLAYAVSVFSQLLSNPSPVHHQAVLRIYSYLQATAELGLTYSGKSDIQCFCDASPGRVNHDYPAISPKSQTGYVFVLNGAALLWNSSKQKKTALHSFTAEYRALQKAAEEADRLYFMLEELRMQKFPIMIYQDNEAVVNTSSFPGHSLLKTVIREYSAVNELIEDFIIQISHVPHTAMTADCLTKGIYGPKLQELAKSFKSWQKKWDYTPGYVEV